MIYNSRFFLLIVFVCGVIAAATDISWKTKLLDDGIDYKVHYAVVNDTVQIKLDSQKMSKGWLGIGFAEPSSGHMKGSDLVTVTIDNSKVKVEDRYATFAPTTYTEQTGAGFQGLTAKIDTTQDWTLISSNSDNNRTIVHIVRKLSTGDNQDREVLPGPTRIVWAYSVGTDYVGYHGVNRGAGTLTFIPSNNGNARNGTIPAHDGSWTYKIENFTIPKQVTTYACQAIELPTDKERHVVAIRPHINPATKSYPHHAILHVCKHNPYWMAHTKPQLCSKGFRFGRGPPRDESGEGVSPVGLPGSGCSSLMWSWAVGMDDFILPNDAGFRIGAKAQDISHIILEMHYDNPAEKEGVIETSGFEIFYTDTLRKYDAAGMTLGDPILGFRNTGSHRLETGNLPSKVEKIHREATCPSECTETFAEDITVFASFLHMHYFGEKIYTQIYAGSKGTPKTTNRIDFWDNGFQAMQESNPYVIKPGDSLQTHCWYNTLGSEEEVKIGIATGDEMCMDFIFYYPRQFKGKDSGGNDLLLGNCGLFYPNEDSAQLSICGSLADTTPGTVQGLPGYVVPGQVSRGPEGYDDPLFFGMGLITSSGKPTTEPISTTSIMISSVSHSGLGFLAIIFAFLFNQM